VDALRGVDADQTDGLLAAVLEADDDGIAIGDALDGGGQGAGRWRTGRLEGWTVGRSLVRRDRGG